MGSCSSQEPPPAHYGYAAPPKYGGDARQHAVLTHAERELLVRLAAGDSTESAESTDETQGRPPLPIVGDMVRVKGWVEEPIGGWGGVKPGDVGLVKEVDELACKVAFAGHAGVWHGFIAEMEVLDEDCQPLEGQHTGMWRHSRTERYCSTVQHKQGPLCTHGPVIQPDHWSCCGSTEFFSVCEGAEEEVVQVGQVAQEEGISDELKLLLLLAAAGAAARQEEAQQEEPCGEDVLISVGDTVRVKPWVTEPKFKWGNVTPGDVGTVREVDGLTCKVHFAKQPSLWTAFVPEMEVLDAAGRPDPERHAGQWRHDRKHYRCSKPGELEGPLCMHGAVEAADHWSCCGNTEVFSRCGERAAPRPVRAAACAIQVGDVVRVKPSVQKPKYDWGNVRYGDRGVVRSVDGQDLEVSFPERQPDRLWRGWAADMDVVQRFGQGSQVKVRPELGEPHFGWGFAARGDIGIVHQLNVQEDKMVVAFPHDDKWLGWTARITDMEVAADVPGQLKAGDRVRVKEWVTEPAGGWGNVRAGDIGIVMRVDQLGCKVTFKSHSGPWNAYVPEMEAIGPGGKPKPGHHPGMWRPDTSKYYCSTASAREGPICTHGEQLDECHWSCCGSTDLFSQCEG